jgi:hypothetical protein
MIPTGWGDEVWRGEWTEPDSGRFRVKNRQRNGAKNYPAWQLGRPGGALVPELRPKDRQGL